MEPLGQRYSRSFQDDFWPDDPSLSPGTPLLKGDCQVDVFAFACLNGGICHTRRRMTSFASYFDAIYPHVLLMNHPYSPISLREIRQAVRWFSLQ